MCSTPSARAASAPTRCGSRRRARRFTRLNAGDGAPQLKTAIRALGFQVSKVEAMKLLAEFDVDNENSVDKESFIKIRASTMGPARRRRGLPLTPSRPGQ